MTKTDTTDVDATIRQIEEIERGLEWVATKGVRVDPVQGDIVEG